MDEPSYPSSTVAVVVVEVKSLLLDASNKPNG
jgi:hypothetical protein